VPLSEPSFHQDPTALGTDTFVIHEVQHALGEPLSVYVNSAVILAEQPVLIDTGSRRNHQAWFEDLRGLVDPKEVRWVFLSHEDGDHVGNLDAVMDQCPNASLIANWALTERHSAAYDFPLDRCRWMDDGTMLDVGDRELAVLRPPIYDAPTTRGLLDTKTSIYWAVDMFATPVPGGPGVEQLARDVSELDDEFWTHGMTMFAHHALAPWLALVDHAAFGAEVQRLAARDISSIISAHSPTITGANVPRAFEKAVALPGTARPPAPDQAVLDLLVAAMAAGT